MKLSDQITRRHLFVAFGTSQQTGSLSSVDLAATRDGASVTLTASDGSVAPISGADASSAGVMTAADKAKLDGLPPTTVRDFDAFAEIPVAGVQEAITHLRTAGHGSGGDGGAALYRRVGVEPSHPFKVQSADGKWWEGVPENGQINPVAIGGDRTEASAQKAFDYAVSQRPLGTISRNAPRIVFSGFWTINSTVTIPNPKDITVDATGAFFHSAEDILMFDLNGLADPTYATAESSQNFHWKGGRFKCTHASPTKATAFRLLGFRHASLEPETFEGFYRDIITGSKDTVYIGKYKTSGVRYASIEFPPWSTIGGPLVFVVDKIHCVPNGSTGGKFVKSYVPLGDSVIRDFSCNLGSNAAQDGLIDLSRNVLIGVGSIGGAFQAGETVTGATSGATMTLTEHYTHDFPFQTAQHEDWLVGSDRSAAAFQAGETVAGATSGATAVIGPHGGYTSQGTHWKNTQIKALHFEAGNGADGAICLRIRNREKRGYGVEMFDLDMGYCGVNGGGAIGVQLEELQRVAIRGRFAQGASSASVPIDLTNCVDVKVYKPTYFSDGGIVLTNMARDELDLSDFDVLHPQTSLVGGWGAKTLSTTSATVLDMSASYVNFGAVGGLSPRGYEVMARVRDSGSTTGGGTYRFRLYHPDSASATQMHEINISGVPDDQWRTGSFLVGANADGDIEYDAVTSGADTMDVILDVRRVLF